MSRAYKIFSKFHIAATLFFTVFGFLFATPDIVEIEIPTAGNHFDSIFSKAVL
jgi:hypothetical protein